MAYSILPKPGSKYGPCQKECSHKDCAITRQQAVAECPICLTTIGYETAFVRDERGLVHFTCAMREAENNKS